MGRLNMTILQSIILGIIQGVTEFIPISSSAHLVITQSLFGWKIPDQQAFIFDVIVHLGTLLAVIIYLRDQVWKIVKSVVLGIIAKHPFKEDAARFGWILILGTIPAVIVGFVFKSQVEQAFSKPVYAGIFLSITALFLILAERIGHRKRSLELVSWKDGLVIGLFQAIALLPGISRSGSAITGGMIRDLDRPSAAQFSFLLSIPAIIGAVSLSIIDLVNSPTFSTQIAPLVVGFIFSTILGYLSVRWLLTFLAKRPLYIFAIYCLVASVTVVLFSLLRS